VIRRHIEESLKNKAYAPIINIRQRHKILEYFVKAFKDSMFPNLDTENDEESMSKARDYIEKNDKNAYNLENDNSDNDNGME
jgi:hypothetical protein